jgi:hypothetical protein
VRDLKHGLNWRRRQFKTHRRKPEGSRQQTRVRQHRCRQREQQAAVSQPIFCLLVFAHFLAEEIRNQTDMPMTKTITNS